jgi:endonuclease/exonuclease/phosphatase family metal-dependent hydrolase
MKPHSLHLRLLTMNLFGVPFVRNTRARLATVGRELNDSHLDVLCFQEVQLTRYLPLLRTAFSNFTHLAYEPFIYAPKGGLLTLSRWPIKSTRFVLYKERGRWHTPAIADWMLHKGVLITELAVREVPVNILNTHLVANYSFNWDKRNRYVRHQESELRQLAHIVNELDPHALATICGDFNIPRGGWLYQEFARATHVLDPLADSDKPTYRPSLLMPSRYAQALDHVFIRPAEGHRLKASAHLVFQDKLRLVNGRSAYLSDHNGIAVHIESHATANEPMNQ